MEHKMANPNKFTHSTIFRQETGFELHIDNGEYVIVGDCTKAEAEAALAAHNPTLPTPPTIIEKLAKLGITPDEAKLLLS